ncbi:MAG: NAD(P)-binding domain-containing protein [Acidobacteria bacterium]|nr:NAD(P)-binding domain-containing protein [Acidobacteriota bacterium]
MLNKLRAALESILSSGSTDQRRPLLDKHYQSNIPDVYVIGDLAGAPVIKLAMAQGVEVIDHIASLPDAKAGDTSMYDLIVVGSGAAGLNAALAARDKGLRVMVLEKAKIANTIEDFPEGKWVYAEPDSQPPKGKLWLDGAQKEDLIARWHQIVRDNHLEAHTDEALETFERQRDRSLLVKSTKTTYRARRLILATGQRGNPRKLGVPGEAREQVYHRLYSPRKYKNEDILVVGGGNSAVEAALVLSEQNRVTLSYRSGEFSRLFKDNAHRLNEAVAAGRIKVFFHSQVQEFGEHEARLAIDRGGRQELISAPYQHAFVLVGADVPVQFLKSLGLRVENDWTGSFVRAIALTLCTLAGLWLFGGQAALFGYSLSHVPQWLGGLAALASLSALILSGARGDRYAWLGVSFLAVYSVYGIKMGKGAEFWPYTGWGYKTFSFFGRPWGFWYTVLYTGLMTVFGLGALKRWGLDRRDKFQIWRYTSLISFQWVFFFLIPEFLFQWAIHYEWVGHKLAADPQFAEQAWRSYGIVYAWPLFFYTFFYSPHQVWMVWGVFLTFVLIPIFALFHGKRYCSWICGCGGLAETFGDRWRHLAPKGKTSIRWESMNTAVLILAGVVTILMLGRDAVALFRQPADWGVSLYRLYVDVWMVGILPVTLYPFLGGKVWCRYWCPLAKLMQLMSAFYARLGIRRFKIVANEKCIACHECSRNCQVGIDVMSYALKQQVLDNHTSSCIGCGICVSVCPMDTLSFGQPPLKNGLVSISPTQPH